MGFYQAKDKDGKLIKERWIGEVILGKDAKGKYIRKKKRFRGPKKQCYDAYLEWKSELLSGDYIEDDKILFSTFAADWREKQAIKKLRPKTLATYDSQLKNHILPAIGHMQLKAIKSHHIDDFIFSLSQKGYASSTIDKKYQLLKNIFDRAVKLKRIASSPVAGVDRPKVEHATNQPFNEEERQQLKEALKKQPFDRQVMILLTIATGLRRGELLGLEWKHINLEEKEPEIQVRQQMIASKGGEPTITVPKTKKSIRNIKLPSEIIPLLKEYRRQRIVERLAIGSTWQSKYDLVFSHPDGKAYNPGSIYNYFVSFLKKNGLRHNKFHDLRHLTATILLELNEHPKVVSEILGHASTNITTDTYSHVSPAIHQRAADKLNSFFKPTALSQ